MFIFESGQTSTSDLLDERADKPSWGNTARAPRRRVRTLAVAILINCVMALLCYIFTNASRKQHDLLSGEKAMVLQSTQCTEQCCAQLYSMPAPTSRAFDAFLGISNLTTTEEIAALRTSYALSVSNVKLIADVLYGDLPHPPTYPYRMWSDDILPCLRNGTVIFVETRSLHDWFSNVHRRIGVNYVLMSGDSDDSPRHNAGEPVAQAFANASQVGILHWFVQNCDFPEDHILRRRGQVTCLPLGLSQWTYHGETQSDALAAFRSRHPVLSVSDWMNLRRLKAVGLKSDKTLVAAGFEVENHPKIRGPLADLVVNGSWSAWSDFLPQMPIDELFRTLSRYKFSASPQGKGLDCYRTYELLHLGVIPIVLSSTLDSLFRNLPVLIVDSWDNVTADGLAAVWDSYAGKAWDPSPLYWPYWLARVGRARGRGVPLYSRLVYSDLSAESNLWRVSA